MDNKSLQEYKIPFVGMKNKLYQFEYLISGTFFKNFTTVDIEKCSIEVKIDFDKRENFFLLTFYVDGNIEVPCDRCMEPLSQEIFGDYEVAVKFGIEENLDNKNEDVIYISKNDDFIDLSNLIYEFIVVSIPLRCVHPDLEDGTITCNEEIINKLNNSKEESADPRWAALEKLKNKK